MTITFVTYDDDDDDDSKSALLQYYILITATCTLSDLSILL